MFSHKVDNAHYSRIRKNRFRYSGIALPLVQASTARMNLVDELASILSDGRRFAGPNLHEMQTLSRELVRQSQPHEITAQSFAKALIACQQGEKEGWLSGFEINQQPIFQ